jgi:hypothetical protein
MFDMAILNWQFDIRPKRIADTLSMARALDGPDAGNSLAKLAERHGAGTKGDEVINALGKGGWTSHQKNWRATATTASTTPS